MYSSSLGCGLVNNALCGAIERGVNNDLHLALCLLAEIVEEDECLVSVGAGESNHDWHVYLNLRGCIDNTLSDSVTFHNSTEDVHEDGLDLGVLA